METMNAATLERCCRKPGVSRSAVSRTFTDGASVSVEDAQKVEKGRH
jgi:DNA-binding LacI/PurR family transcriptional regulator